MRTLLGLLAVPLGIYAGFCLLMFLTQRSQIYFPVGESSAPGASSLSLARDGVEVKIWVVSRPGPRALLYFGGNAEDVAGSVGSFSQAFPAHSLYLMNYRGYGGSSGRPSEPALVDDAVALYDELEPRHAEISVIGRSLGSAVAMQLASRREVRDLVLISPFDSLVNVARFHMPYLPVRLLLLDRYDSATVAARIDARTLIVVAGADEIIPRARSEALAAAFASPPQVSVVEGARHNDLDRHPQFLAGIRRFLTR